MLVWKIITDFSSLRVSPIAFQAAPEREFLRIFFQICLSNWVKQGNAPTQLVAQNITEIDPATGDLVSGNATERGRPLCLYPLIQSYIRGDPALQSSFDCVEEL